MNSLLLVEDNPGYRQAALDVLTSRYDLRLARDYSEAMDRIIAPGLAVVVTDCFFPEKAGSGNILRGQELVERMAWSDPREKKIREYVEAVRESLTFDESTLRNYASFMADHSLGQEAGTSQLVRVVQHIATTLGKEAATRALVNTLERPVIRDSALCKDYYAALQKAILESEAHQPLGVLVAEKAQELKLPFVLTTSTYHHDILTQPIQNYTQRQGWRLLDCGPGQEKDKASREFWERVVKELSSLIKKG